MVVDIARIHKVLVSPAGIKYKFGIQIPKGIENSIKLDTNNEQQLMEESIKTVLSNLETIRHS
jgi:hypothetical protein